MACASSTREAVKVVVINTRYVETDPTSFKSVVQSLTGKDSCVAWIEKSSYDAEKRKSSVAVVKRSVHDSNIGGCGNTSVPMLLKGMSFKDFHNLMLEMPPMEKLPWV